MDRPKPYDGWVYTGRLCHLWRAGQCPPKWRATRTLASGFVGAPGLCAPAGGASWCGAGQPAWSAFRQPAFGFGTLDVVNATHLLWAWHACALRPAVPTCA